MSSYFLTLLFLKIIMISFEFFVQFNINFNILLALYKKLAVLNPIPDDKVTLNTAFMLNLASIQYIYQQDNTNYI